MLKLKRVVASLLATATVSALSIGALAVDYKHWEFDLSPSKGSYQFSGRAEKQDNEDSALIHCESGSVSSARSLTVAVYKAKTFTTSNCISTPIAVSDANDKQYYIDYTVDRGAGSINYLCASAGYYSAKITGHWDP